MHGGHGVKVSWGSIPRSPPLWEVQRGDEDGGACARRTWAAAARSVSSRDGWSMTPVSYGCGELKPFHNLLNLFF